MKISRAASIFLVGRRSSRWCGGGTKGISEFSVVGFGVGRLIGWNRVTGDENGLSVGMRENLRNTYLKSEGGGLVRSVLITSFMSAHGIKIGLIKGYVGGTLVGISGGKKYVTAMVQEDVMYDDKEPVGLRGGGYGAATIMEFCNMEGYAVSFLTGVAEFVVRSILVGDKVKESVLSGGNFEASGDGNLEGLGPGEGHPLVVS